MNTTNESKDDKSKIKTELLSNDSSDNVQPSVSEGQQQVLLNVEEDRKITQLNQNTTSSKNLKRRKKYSSPNTVKLSSRSRNDTQSTDSSPEEQNDKNLSHSSKRKARRKSCISFKKNSRIENSKPRKSTSDSDSEPNNSILLDPNIPVVVINNLNIDIWRNENDKGKETDFTPSEQSSDAVCNDQKDEGLFEKKDILNKRNISYSLKKSGLKNIDLAENLSNMMQEIRKHIEYPTNLETNTKKKSIVKTDSDSSCSDILVESFKVETITIDADSTSDRLVESSEIETITIDSGSPASIILEEDSEIETCVIKRSSTDSKIGNPEDSSANENFTTEVKNKIFTKNDVLQKGSLSSFSSKNFNNKYESKIPPVDIISSNSYLCNSKLLYDMHEKPKMVDESTESSDINAKEINATELKRILQTVKNLHSDDVSDDGNKMLETNDMQKINANDGLTAETKTKNNQHVCKGYKTISHFRKNNVEKKYPHRFYGNWILRKTLKKRGQSQACKVNAIPTTQVFEKNENTFNAEGFHTPIEVPDINMDLAGNYYQTNMNKYTKSNVNNKIPESIYYKSQSSNSYFINNEITKSTSNSALNTHLEIPTQNDFTNGKTNSLNIPFSFSSNSLNNDDTSNKKSASNTPEPSTNFMPSTIPYLYSTNHCDDANVLDRFFCSSSTLPSKNPPTFSDTSVQFLQMDSQKQAASSTFDRNLSVVSGNTNYSLPSYTAFRHTSTSAKHPLDFSTPSFKKGILSTFSHKEKENKEGHQISDEQCYSQNLRNCTLNSSFTNPIFSSGIYQNELCLLPSDMKCSIGKETIQTNDVLLLILEWNVDWLTVHNNDWYPPVLSQNLRKVVSSYQNFENYYNTFFPLMMLETWHRMYISWSDFKKAPQIIANITSYSVHKHHVIIECTTVFNTDPRAKMIYPDVGKIIIVKSPIISEGHAFKMFGYVTQCNTLNYNPGSISHRMEINKSNFLLCFTFIGVYNHKNIKVHMSVVINVLSSIQSNLKQNDALLYVRKSPLQRNILNPVANGLLSITQQNTSANEINKCIQLILESIFSPRPVPVITVKTCPGSACSEFIPELVTDLKQNCGEMKVLLCVRSLETLGRIAAQLILVRVKFVIFNSRRDTNFMFHNFLLDNIAEARAKKENREDNILNIKKSILLESDIILLPIKHSFDEILTETFAERKNARNLFCIIYEADICTETETLIPILHGISKLILIGNGVQKPKVLSKTAREFNFDQSFFHRAHKMPSPSEIT